MAEEAKKKVTKTTKVVKEVKEPKKTKKVEEVEAEKKVEEVKEVNETETSEKEEKVVSNQQNNGQTVNDIWNKFINTISNVYKKPSTTIKEEVGNPDVKNSLIMLVAIAISFGLCLMAGFKSILSATYGGITISDVVEIPYFKVFLYTTVIYALLSFVPIVVSFVISRVMKDETFDFKKAISLYSTSMSVVVPTNLILALLYALNFLAWVGEIMVAVVAIFGFFNYVLGYINVNNFAEDKKSYALTSLVVVWVICAFLGLAVLLGSMTSDLTKDTLDFNSTNYSDIWDW